jgi:hypothetical protein
MSLPLPCLSLTQNHRKPGLFLGNVDNIDNLKAKVSRFQSIQTLSIQTLTLTKIYREVREAGSRPGPAQPPMPRSVALKLQPSRLVPLSLPFRGRSNLPQHDYGKDNNFMAGLAILCYQQEAQDSGARHQTSPESPDISRLRTSAAIPTNSPLLEVCEIASQWPCQAPWESMQKAHAIPI